MLGRILIICLFSFINITSGLSQTNNKDLYAFDSIFKTASNSPAYVVASKAQIQELKKILSQEKSDLIRKAEEKDKELSQLKAKMDSLATNGDVTEILATSSTSSVSYWPFLIGIFILLVALGVICLRNLGARKIVKESEDSYRNLVREFETHKRLAIERERKLMRRVIDLQNDLEEKSSPTA
jgi:hypothetical protein